MNVKILGTGTASPTVKRASSAYLVSTGSCTVLIDIGPSIVRRLVEFGIPLNTIDIILLTHFHPDHTVDLVTFLFAANYGEPQRHRPLLIIGGKGLRDFYARLKTAYPWIHPLAYRLKFKTMAKGVHVTHGIRIVTDRMNHRDESIGARIESAGKSVVFSGDTDYAPSLGRLASGADLLVAECSFPIRKVEGHLNLPALMKAVGQAHAEQVLLTHLYPSWEDFTGPLPAPLMLAEDGMEIIL